MAEYIKREYALLSLTQDGCLASSIESIKNIPAADVVPVVHCRESNHYEMGVCLKIYSDGNANKDAWQRRKPDDFCSYGERKEEQYCLVDL